MYGPVMFPLIIAEKLETQWTCPLVQINQVLQLSELVIIWK